MPTTPKLVSATINNTNFTYYVLKIPKRDANLKFSSIRIDPGTFSRIDYQNFIFSEFIIAPERLYLFMSDYTGGDTQRQIKIRDEIEEKIYEINNYLDPSNLVAVEDGTPAVPVEGGLPFEAGEIKFREDDDSGTDLRDLPGWHALTDEVNPYVVIEEVEILDAPPSEDDIFSEEDEGGTNLMGGFETVKKRWERVGIDLFIRKFTKQDLPFIFGPELAFEEDFHYKIHIIQKCLEKAESIFALCDAMGLTAEVKIPALAEELYSFCVEVNPFLKLEEIDLEDIRAKTNNVKKTKKKKGNLTKTKTGSGKKFTDVTKKELLSLPGRMKARVIGQEESIDKIVDTIQIASCGLRDPEKPIAAYLMCGSTGVGKTLTSKVLAEELCGSKNNMVRIDCSEYTQQHDVQKLIGAPPSYIGYEDGGFLTNAVQENPFSVVLFDEIEKAHSKLFDLLLQIMDDARLTDGKGNVTHFNDCIVLLTSNIGVSEAEDVKSTMGFGDAGLLTENRKEGALKRALKNRFRPEFLNRIDETLSFRNLDKDDALKVIDLLLNRVKGYLKDKDITAEFTDEVRDMIFDRGFSKKYGARPLQRTIDKEVVKSMAKMLLKDDISEGASIVVGYDGENVTIKRKNSNKTKELTSGTKKAKV